MASQSAIPQSQPMDDLLAQSRPVALFVTHPVASVSMSGEMQFFDDVSLPGNGDISGVFWSSDRQILAVSSSFRLLTEPPARAAYGGQKLHQRLALYRPPAFRPLAVFDDASFPIRDVAFHPTRPIVALGTGSYDGGYMFEGQLVIWDWRASTFEKVRSIPEVVRLRFAPNTSDVEAMVRPWDEGYAEGRGDPFDMFFKIDLADVLSGKLDRFSEREIGAQLDGQRPRTASALAVDPNFPSLAANPSAEIARAFAFSSFRRRSPLWDVALIEADTIGIVHDDCLLELFGNDGTRLQSFTGRGHGSQILRGKQLLVHATQFDKTASDWSASTKTSLLKLNKGELSAVTSLVGRYTFSVSQSGSVLGRCDRSADRKSLKADVILSADCKTMTQHDLGHYDCFNHYLRADGAPQLFFVQGTPPASHKDKHLCAVSPAGAVTRIWPLLEDHGDQASHAMECCYCYIHDDNGPGMIVSGKHYNSRPSGAYEGFVYRRNLDGTELWRHPTNSSAASIRVTPRTTIVLLAFLDGSFAMMRGDTGEVMSWDVFRPDGHGTVIMSLDVDDNRVVIGTIDGRCGAMPAKNVVASGLG